MYLCLGWVDPEATLFYITAASVRITELVLGEQFRSPFKASSQQKVFTTVFPNLAMKSQTHQIQREGT